MTERYTAAMARRDAGPNLDEKIDSLLESIKARAEKGHREIKTGWHHKADDDLWINGGYENTEEWIKAKKALEKLGYTVKFYYNCGQFVDMYTLVKW